jgi:ABC-type multidrug transport system fused ATPase/permease subunit
MLGKLLKPLMKLVKPVMGSMNLNILVQMLLILYSSVLVPRLPTIVMKLFNNTFVKVIIMSLIAYVSTKNIRTALMMALALIITLTYINKVIVAKGPRDLLNAVIDAPQEVLNKVTDDAQEIKTMGVEETGDLLSPVKPLLNAANNVIDTIVDSVQNTANNVIDKTQETVLGKLEPFSNDNMENIGKL